MTIEIVDFPIKHGGSFHSYVSLPEGMENCTPRGLPFCENFPGQAWSQQAAKQLQVPQSATATF